MLRTFHYLLLTLLLAGIPSAQTNQKKKGARYPAPDGTAQVVVVAKSQLPSGGLENQVEFYFADGRRQCALDYSSYDGDHGFSVAKAAWTPDSKYFVYSLTSSGGHQAWHAPTQFFKKSSGLILTLDDYLDGAGITTPDFQLEAPNVLKTRIQLEEETDITVRLDALRITSRSKRPGKPFFVACDRGRTTHVEAP